MVNKNKKLFIVRTYVMANDARQALRLASKMPPHECWVDEEWKKNNQPNPTRLENAIGFNVYHND